MRFDQYLNEMNVTKHLKVIKKLGGVKLKSMLKDSFNKFTDILAQHGLEQDFLKIFNAQFKTSYKSFKQLKSLKESEELNEDWKNFLNFWKSETYPALSIFPALQIWFQVDKLISGAHIKDLDFKKIAIYGVLWLIILTGQHMLLFRKWKKENPSEWEEEGKPGIFRKGKVK